MKAAVGDDVASYWHSSIEKDWSSCETASLFISVASTIDYRRWSPRTEANAEGWPGRVRPELQAGPLET